MSVAEVEEAEPSEAEQVLARRLAIVLRRMRAEGRFNLDQFLGACEAGMGGTVVVTAPSTKSKRDVPECRYVSEGVTVTGSLSFDPPRRVG